MSHLCHFCATRVANFDVLYLNYNGMIGVDFYAIICKKIDPKWSEANKINTSATFGHLCAIRVANFRFSSLSYNIVFGIDLYDFDDEKSIASGFKPIKSKEPRLPFSYHTGGKNWGFKIKL